MSTKNLLAALLSAQKAAEPVIKDGNNTFMRYKYATAEAMMEEAKRCLNQAGLVLALVAKTVQASANGGTELVQKLLLAHPESGESMELTTTMAIVIDKGKAADKAEAATATFDLGYFVRSLLLLVRDEAEAVNARDDRKLPDQATVIAELKASIASAKVRDDLAPIRAKATELGLAPAIKDAYTAKFQELAAAAS